MASYDTVTISSQSVPRNVLHLSTNHNDDMADDFNHGLDFQGEAMFDLNADLPSIPFAPSYDFDAFSTTFDDPLSYQTGIFDTFLEENTQNSESLPVDLDNKLLGFGAPIHKLPVLDENGQTWPRMTAELNGMFCVAEDVFEGDTAGRPLELTCYRRNLFQISGNITLSRTIGHVLADQGRRAAIYDLMVTLSATESIEGKSTEIISVPWKTGNANGAPSDDKTGSAPTNIPVDLTSNQETDSLQVSIPMAWGRLQFKYATANNGRRKGLQQHYQVQISLMGRLQEDGQLIKLAEIQSNPIVVRGRSPKNFDSSKDVPLSDRKSEATSRTKATTVAPQTHWIEPALSHGSQRYYNQKSSEQSMDAMGWPNPQPQPNSNPDHHRSKKPASMSPMAQKRRPPVPQPQWKTEPADEQPPSKPPTGLSLIDEDFASNSSGTVPSQSPEKRTTRTSVTSPLETADLLYEYFPLSLDDWMPPVDAIYRPHVVHHLRVPVEVKAQQLRAKPKRYFSADEESAGELR